MDEKEYLSKTISEIQSQLASGLIEIGQKKAQAEKTRDYISMNYYDLDNEELSRHKLDLDEAERDLEILEKHNSRLERQVDRPYFARIDFNDGQTSQKIYIGLGHVAKDGSSLVYDWRAPVSSMYYGFDKGPASYVCEDGKVEGEITLKRQFSIEDGKLNYYVDTDENLNDEILQQVLSNKASSKMREIVSTIQREQNALIRADEKDSLLIQGVAGSGKTSVALHRAGYLLYKNPKLTSNDIFILSPSPLFSGYVSEVLPELGEDNIMDTTFITIAKAELKQTIESRESMIDKLTVNKDKKKLEAIAYKSSFAFLEDLIEFLNTSLANTFHAKDLKFYAKDVEEPLFSFSKEEMDNLYYNTYKNLEVYKRISYMSEYLIERFNLRKNEFKPIKERFSKMLYNFFPSTDPHRILEIFLSLQGFEQERSNIVGFDDVAGVMIIKEFMYGLKTDMPAKYIIVDEVQDFSPAHFYLFNKIWQCPKLYLGDINQCIEKKLTNEYLDKLKDYLGCQLITLNKTYRSTKEISVLSQKIIEQKDVVNMNRSGEEPEVIKSADQLQTIKDLIVKNQSSFRLIAVICKTFERAEKVFEFLKRSLDVQLLSEKDVNINKKVVITTAPKIKGLEFDYCIIPDLDSKNYYDELDKNLLYVSTTRALHKLSLTYSDELTKFLKTGKRPKRKV